MLRIGALVFRHEPTGEIGEVSGHLHPAAKIIGRGRSVRRRCFASDGARLVMPAMGAFTGGLNVLDEAFAPIFPEGAMAFALGQARVFMVAAKSLVAYAAVAGRIAAALALIVAFSGFASSAPTTGMPIESRLPKI